MATMNLNELPPEAFSKLPKRQPPPLAGGLIVPLAIIFKEDRRIDFEKTVLHTLRVLRAGVNGLLVFGFDEEAIFFGLSQRTAIIKHIRNALDRTGKKDLPLIVACSGETPSVAFSLCLGASAVGATHALIQPPASGLADATDLYNHFVCVANMSPLPVVVYNNPDITSNKLSLSKEQLVQLSKHYNIAGCRLHANDDDIIVNVGIAAIGTSFKTFGSNCGFALDVRILQGHGVFGDLGNIAPRSLLRMFKLQDEGKHNKAVEIQRVMLRAERQVKKSYPYYKAVLQYVHGYGGMPPTRDNLPKGETLEKLMDPLRELLDLEAKIREQQSQEEKNLQ